jgi:soluble lytic murein transglycosylase
VTSASASHQPKIFARTSQESSKRWTTDLLGPIPAASFFGMLARLVLVVSVGLSTGSPAAPARFKPEDAAPYFAAGPAAEAAARLRLEEWVQAAKGFELYLQKHSRAADHKQAQFLHAYAELKAGQFANAARDFDLLVKSYPLLADYHRTWAARASLQADRANDALARAKAVPSTSALDGDARFVRADALGDLGRWADAAAEYAAYLEAYPASWRSAEARFRLGEMLEKDGRKDDAVKQFRRLYLEAPTESWGRQAEAHLPKDALGFSAVELAGRAMQLFDQMRNVEAEHEWLKLLAAPGCTPELTCSARFHAAQSVFKQRERWRSAPLFDAAIEACEKAKDDDLLAKALYQAGRAWGQKGDKDLTATQKALSLFDRLWREHPTHSYADDARLREAEMCDEIKDDAKASELYAGIPTSFPAGDQKGEALWRLAFRAWRKGDYKAAQDWLESELKLLPREDGWWEAGRTLYWLGRIADHNGEGEQAASRYAQAAREYPLSYYSLVALNRLREKWPDKLTALLGELSREPAGETDREWSFKPRPLFGEPGFRRGLELARLGLGPEAKRELALAGIEVPKKRTDKVDDPDKQELLWLAAVLYDRAGEYAISHFIPRWILTEFQKSWPIGAARKKWLLSYPRGYAELIDKHARLNGQPPALEFAIVREESAFDPLMESFANAVGLTQLTAPPAARYANGLPHDRQALRDPAINVTIGARELGALWASYAGNPALAIAGYNAGEGAVNRWLRDPERAGLATDEWIEAIPYDETRGYTKRVLSSYFAYLWLFSAKPDERVPALPLALPARKNK